jgi:hypothetical protein
MNKTKDELLLECIKQFEHIEDVLGFNRLSTTKSLINEIEQALRIHDVVGRSEQLKAFMHFAEFAKQEYGLHIPLNLMKEYVKNL